jgi:ketosteroid isomerase-like protein
MPDGPVLCQPRPRSARSSTVEWGATLDADGADVTLNTTEVDSSGDLAYGIGQYSFTLPLASGGRMRDQGKYLVVFRRQADGSWKAIADMFSSDQPLG